MANIKKKELCSQTENFLSSLILHFCPTSGEILC